LRNAEREPALTKVRAGLVLGRRGREIQPCRLSPKIAQPFKAGWKRLQEIIESRMGRQTIPFVPKGLAMFPHDEPSHKWLGYYQNYGARRSRWGWWSRFQALKAASLVSAKRNCSVGDSTWLSQKTTLARP
jgi:hypothetical protein